eukprot:TRINITY_DN3003_c0_g1_i5.p1 TRINITY_DN3003_c0_g1~~TRINITY_DN3003_c0_g1_i5.p1  ORF type:complete len:176 (-),score=22.94 TRINITY_DN3003_c0_g1_i5:191-718(-)
MNQEVAHRDEKIARSGTALAAFALILSVLTLNPITSAGALFCFLVLKQSYSFWKHWQNCIKLFYIISLVAAVVEAVGLLVFFIYCHSVESSPKSLEEAQGAQYKDSKQHNMRTVIVLLCLSGLELALIVKAYRSVFYLYIEFADDCLLESSELVVIDPVATKCRPKSQNCLQTYA